MRVCLISHTAELAGAERSLMDVVAALTLRGVRCHVVDGFNGYLYPPGDWIALADRIEAMCCDRDAALALARRAQDWAARTFNAERTANELLGVLREITASAKVALGPAEGRRNA